MNIVLTKYKSLQLFAALIFVSGLLVSCEDFLDQKPTDGLVYSEYWKNKEEVLSTLGGAYQKLAEMDYRLFVLSELRSDMLKKNGTYTTGDELKIMESNILESNSYAKWDKFYTVINICNHVIKLAPGVQEKDQTFSDILVQKYVSEATFLRALTYFYLVRIFQDVPYITEPTSNDQVEFFVSQTPGETILERTKEDLKAIHNFELSYPTLEQSRSRVSKGAINALLADICLWNFEYDECLTYIDEIESSGEYFLLEPIEWFDNYKLGFTSENIFEIFYDEPSAQGNRLASNTYNSSNPNQAKYYVSDYAVEILGPDLDQAGEVTRGNGTFSYDDIDNYQIWKYIGQNGDRTTKRPSSSDASANYIIYRLADVYLMKAEALSQKDNPSFALATEYLNMISLRANMNPHPVYGDKETYEDIVLEERAKELAYEGKRWFDLLRMGRRSERGKTKLIDILVSNVPSTQQLVMKSKLSDPNGWYMPVHSDEINRNKNLKQNPYYDEN